MKDSCAERSRRVWGRRQLRRSVSLTLAVAVLAVSAQVAGGASGGARPARVTSPPIARIASGSPFAARGMWIWELSSSNGGNLSSIVARARQNGITTLLIKGGDGSGTWSQFNPSLVSALHRSGMRVCAWQYVYGNDPVGEAQVGVAMVRDGADCLVIDAETEYEGKYVSAQTYLRTLRGRIGQSFPVALAGFPYVDFHPGFPYSVFLGPGGAQYNVPQMYWQDIQTTVDGVYAHTYAFNRVYGRPIAPLGQIYNGPPARQIRRFRLLSRAYGAPNVSWWDWQEGTPGAFHAVSTSLGALPGFTPYTALATLGVRAQGDLVVWAQQHLVSAGQNITVDGGFGPGTLAAVKRFQSARGLAADGVIGTGTWSALLRFRPATVAWVIKRKRQQAVITRDGVHIELVPKSAKLKAKHNEIPASIGSGRP
jgi:hypothetical protein